MQKNLVLFLFFMICFDSLVANPIILKSDNKGLVFKIDISKKYNWGSVIIDGYVPVNG